MFDHFVMSKVFAVEINRQDREQHQHRTSQRIEEEFDRRVQPPLAAPHADQEIHRHEHHFPENVEQHEIERHENAEHAGLQQQQQDVVFLFAFVNCGPRREDRNRAEHVVSITSRKLRPSMPSV